MSAMDGQADTLTAVMQTSMYWGHAKVLRHRKEQATGVPKPAAARITHQRIGSCPLFCTQHIVLQLPCTLRQLEQVLQAVDDAQAAVRRQLPDVTRVEEAVSICQPQKPTSPPGRCDHA